MYQYNIEVSYNNDESYQATILSLFNLTEYNNVIIQQTIDEIVVAIKYCPEWLALLKQVAGKHLLTYEVDEALSLTILLSYEYLKEFHTAIKQYHLDKTINLQALHDLLAEN